MNNKVIEVLDYMGQKLGIAIDWTAENVMPQVTEFLGRYKVYAIVEHSLYAIMLIIVIAIMIAFLKKMFKGIATKNRDNIWYNLSWCTDGAVPFMITFFTIVVIGFIVTYIDDHVFDIAKWALIPEIQFFETLSSYLNGIK
jgi:hypothetical protein